MSNDETTPGSGPTAAPNRRRRIWVATGVAGLTGVVGLAAIGGLAARNDRSDDTKTDQHAASTRQNVSDTGRAEEEAGEESGKDDWRDEWSDRDERDHDEGQVREVRCDDDALVEAFVRLNNEEGGT
ncbi:hypothetical protein ACGFIZ_27575, partial [Micromonospora sp. NPDC048830]